VYHCFHDIKILFSLNLQNFGYSVFIIIIIIIIINNNEFLHVGLFTVFYLLLFILYVPDVCTICI
jgi:hypothetical protein